MPSSPVRRGGRPVTPSTNGTATITAPAPQSAAAPIVHAEVQQPRPVRTIETLLRDPVVQQQMALALPQNMTAERLARIALTEVRRNPKLANCDQASFLGALMQCAQLGVEPGGPLGQAHLIPFENRRKGIVECQFILGYRGMLDLAARSGRVSVRPARIVRQGDDFRYSYGLTEDLHHTSCGKPAPMTHVYIVAELDSGARVFEVMTREEVEDVRNNSQGYKSAIKYNKNDNPWITNFDAMAKKTVARQLFKWLPVSVELATAVSLDEQTDRGYQDNPLGFMVAPKLAAQQGKIANLWADALPGAHATPTISPELHQSLTDAIGRRLTVVGEAALTAELDADGIGSFLDLPVDRFDALMRQLADGNTVALWNHGQASDGEVLLSNEQIRVLTVEQDPGPQQPAQVIQAAPAPQAQAAALAAAAAEDAAAAEEPEDGEQASFV